MTEARPKIALRKISQLVPDPRNARTHSESQVDTIVASINRFGWTNPMLADDLIRAGHGRLMAAQKIYESGGRIYAAPGRDHDGILLPDGTVPVIDCTGWTEDERKAYALADNQIALQAGWDQEQLAEQLSELANADFSLVDIGFDNAALEALNFFDRGASEADPEALPEEPAVPTSILGDIWVLGDHRLACGDSTDPETVNTLLAGAKPHLMVTDPPYGVEYDASHRRALQSRNSKPAQGQVMNDDRADWSDAWALFPGDAVYVWHSGTKAHVVADSLIKMGFEVRAQIIWAKSKFVIGRGHYHPHHEPCWYAVRNKSGSTGHWQGDRKQSTLWQIEHRKSETGHSTQKPVECMKRPIENNSKRGDAVYEPFAGSSTTIIAAEMTGRRCLACELNPAYVDMGVMRWQEFTGREAVHAVTGKTFAESVADRLVLTE